MQPKRRSNRSFTGRLILLALSISALGAQSVRAARQAEGPHETGRVRVKNLAEVSGLAASRQNPDVLWVHNDGGRKQVFAVTTEGTLIARVRVPVTLHDVEDIAIGPGPEKEVDYVYLGDIGDNESSRREIQVIRFAEPALENDNDKIKADDIEVFQLRYPDGPHDAESLMVDAVTGDLFIVAKENGRSRLYRLAANALRSDAPATLELAGYLNVDDISAGDISRAGDLIILRSEDRGWIWSRPSGASIATSFQRAPRIVLVRAAGQAQNGEAVGFSPDGKSYYTISEGDHEAIVVFPLPAGVDGGRRRPGVAR
jgi:hypothetical protein